MTEANMIKHAYGHSKKEVMGWLINIAYNYNHDIGGIYRNLMDMAKELNLSMYMIDHKWQYSPSMGKKITADTLYFIFFRD